jgi:parallel beta helix pectate lyase-like protein
MTAQLSPTPLFKGFDNNGLPLAFGTLTTYQAGTTTPQATYVDSTQTTTNTNPITLNFRGECALWLDPTKSYKFLLQDSPGNTIPGYPVDNIPGTALVGSIGFNLIPNPSNTYTLGTPTNSFANLYLGANDAPALGASGNIGYYKRTPAEISISVTPTDYSYPADPYVDPRRYGADPTGATVSTIAVQTALNVAYAAKGMLWIGNGCTYLTGALFLTLSGNHGNDGIHIMGSCSGGSQLTQSGTPAALITFTGPSPTGNPGDAPVLVENLTLNLSGQTTDGLVFVGLAFAQVKNVVMSAGGNRCIFFNSTLTSEVDHCDFLNSQYGIYARTDGAGAPPNIIRIRNCSAAGCMQFAVDYDTGSELHLIDNDFEGNGTSITATGAIASTSTSATLIAPWPNPTVTQTVTFSDGEMKAVLFTKGSTAISWSGGLANTVTSALINSTGAIHIGSSINCFPTFGFAKVWMENNWLEGNLGGWSILVDAPTLGQLTNISIRGGHTISASNGAAIKVSGCDKLLIEDHYSIAPQDTWNLTYTSGLLCNTNTVNLLDNGTYPTFQNVSGPSGVFHNGRGDSALLTLTGCSGTAPTGNVTINQQGDDIELRFLSNILGTSNSTACTLTGLPAKYWPANDSVGQLFTQDNGVFAVLGAVVAAATGIITIGFAHTFATSGGKGVGGGELRFRRP